MLETMFNTMRVLVEGASNDDDVKLIPTNIFKGREDFNEAVVELLETADIVKIFHPAFILSLSFSHPKENIKISKRHRHLVLCITILLHFFL